MENEQKMSFKNKIALWAKGVKEFVIAKKLLRIIIPTAIVLAAAVVINVGVLILNNYVLFPRIDKALANSLEAKLDIGTTFDVADLFEKGKVELEADDVRHIGMGSAGLDVSISYNGKETAGSLDFSNRHIEAVITEDGIAASSSDIDNGARYGAYFEDIASTLESSFLNPKNNSENALKRAEYEKLLARAQKLEDKATKGGENKKDTIVVLGEVLKVFKASSLSDRDVSYDGVYVGGEKRNARKLTYEFNKAEIVEFVEGLEALFAEPSDKLRAATERLLGNKSVTKAIEDMGYTLESCEDLSKFIGDLTKLVNLFNEAEATLEIAYVNDAITAIVFECDLGGTDVELVVDFGEKPKKDKEMSAVLTVISESARTESEKTYSLRYSVKKDKKVNTVSAVYNAESFVKDGLAEERETAEHSVTITLDTKNDTARFLLGRSSRSAIDGVENSSDGRSYDISCSMDDRFSKISFTLLGLTIDGDNVYEPTGDIKLTLYKKPDRISLGKFTELLKKDVADADKIATPAVSKLTTTLNLLKNLEPVTLKSGSAADIESDVYFDGFFIYEYDTYYYDQFSFSSNKYERWIYDGQSNQMESGTYFVSGDVITFIPEGKERYEQNITSIGENSFVVEGNLYVRM